MKANRSHQQLLRQINNLTIFKQVTIPANDMCCMYICTSTYTYIHLFACRYICVRLCACVCLCAMENGNGNWSCKQSVALMSCPAILTATTTTPATTTTATPAL